jgi:hypothetical protein
VADVAGALGVVWAVIWVGTPGGDVGGYLVRWLVGVGWGLILWFPVFVPLFARAHKREAGAFGERFPGCVTIWRRSRGEEAMEVNPMLAAKKTQDKKPRVMKVGGRVCIGSVAGGGAWRGPSNLVCMCLSTHHHR